MDTQTKSDNVPDQKAKQPWFGSNSSDMDKRDEGFMTFQSKDPIISIQLEDKTSKEKEVHNETQHVGGGGGHSFGVEHPTSYLETLMHLFKGNIGSGLFAMGDAIKNGGLVVGPCIVIILGITCVHCQHLLITASKKMLKTTNIKRAPDFAETVELCFANGPKKIQRWSVVMRRVVNTFLCITQFGFCCVYFMFISSNVKQVMDYYGVVLDVHLHMAIAFLPILLTALVRNLKYLAPFSALANAFMFVGIVITLYFMVQDLPSPNEREFVATLAQFPLFFGTALFSFEGIGLVLPLRNEMKKPKHFQKPFGVLNVGMGVVATLYVVIGTLGYLKYGDAVEGSLTLNLPQDNVLGQSVKVVISTGILLTFALMFYIPIDIMWPSVSASLGPFKFPVLAECTFRSAFVLVTFTLAEAIPYLNLFISLVGAVSSTALALLFPPLLEIVTKSTTSELNALTLLKDVVILIIGIIGMFTGTYESISSIAKAFRESSL